MMFTLYERNCTVSDHFRARSGAEAEFVAHRKVPDAIICQKNLPKKIKQKIETLRLRTERMILSIFFALTPGMRLNIACDEKTSVKPKISYICEKPSGTRQRLLHDHRHRGL
jgi:hypothetical protein